MDEEDQGQTSDQEDNSTAGYRPLSRSPSAMPAGPHPPAAAVFASPPKQESTPIVPSNHTAAAYGYQARTHPHHPPPPPPSYPMPSYAPMIPVSYSTHPSGISGTPAMHYQPSPPPSRPPPAHSLGIPPSPQTQAYHSPPRNLSPQPAIVKPEFAAPSSQVRSSPILPPTEKKPPNLRVQIPSEQPTSSTANNTNATTTATTNTTAATAAATVASEAPTPRKSDGPLSSALPSQFAQNLPSPSTFYPEFYQQNELPSPLNFSATPTTTSAFNWPPPTARDYKPSPLARVENG